VPESVGTSAQPMTSHLTWDSSYRSHRPTAAFVTLGAFLLVPGLVATVLRLVPPSDDGTALLAAFIPYGLVAYALAVLCFGIAVLVARRKAVVLVVFALVAALFALHLSWIVPLFVSDGRAATTKPFTVFSLNMHGGQANPAQVAAQAADADVVVLVEATPGALRALKEFNWDKRFRYSVGDVRDDISNTAIYSRFPLSHSAPLPATSFAQYVTTAKVPGIGALRIIAAHPCNPYCGQGRWASEHAVLRDVVEENLNQPLMVVGDLNAVDDHGPIRALRDDGLESATDIVGAGWLPTYPANRALPPLLPIDHVLLSDQLTATSIVTVEIDDTDHLGLVATVAGAG
jgi:endonuclease/exonuclease/phosphatase (EEP) superfamily protein YafD